MVVSTLAALHHFEAPTTIMCGRVSRFWSMKNGVPLRGALGEVSNHGILSLPRLRFRGMLLEDAAVIRAHKCFLHACRARLRLHTACRERLRTVIEKVMVLYGGLVCRGFVCRWSLAFSTEGFYNTPLRVGSSACEEGRVSEASMLARSVSSVC